MRHIHNTSFIIKESIEKQWIEFIRENYIEELKNSGLCDDVIFTKVSIDQPEGKTYSVQVVFSGSQQLDRFLENRLPQIEKKIIERYKNQYLCFSSILTEV